MGIEAQSSSSRIQATLITPSASPPSSRSFFPQPYRIPDQPSPTKRPRLASTSRQLQQENGTPSTSTSADPFVFQQAREDSTMRLLNIWSSLDRYVKPLDEDDIVDITTGKLIKDRGILRGSQRWDVGYFANGMGVEDGEGGGEEEDEEDEDDVDELDAFVDEEVQELGVDINSRNVPPVRAMDPADARDLEEFLEAERRRKEEYGSDPEDSGSSEYDFRRDDSKKVGPSRRGTDVNHNKQKVSTSVVGWVTPAKAAKVVKQPHQSVVKSTELQRNADDSTDELDNWDMDEASMVYKVSKDDDFESSDSEIEFVETIFVRPSGPGATSSKTTEKSAPKTNAPSRLVVQQLHTPPRSHASTDIPTSPFEEVIELPPDSSSPARSFSPTFAYEDVPSHSLFDFTSHSSEPLTQKISASDNTLHIDLRQSSQSENFVPPVTRLASSDQIHSSASTEMAQPSQPLAGFNPTATSRNKSVPVNRGIRQVEVVITAKPPTGAHRKSTLVHSKRKESHPSQATESGRDSTSKIKGKQKAPVIEEESDGESVASRDSSPSPHSKASPKALKPPIKGSTNHPKAGTHAPRTQPPSSPPKAVEYGEIQNKGTSRIKRKRIASSSVEEAPASEAQPLDASRVVTRNVKEKHRPSEETQPLKTTLLDKNAQADRAISKPKQMSRSRRRSPSPESSSAEESPPRETRRRQRRPSRTPSQLRPPQGDPQYHPFPQMVYPPNPSGSHPHTYPVPDPRAQYIISQAMHQLSALVGTWPPPNTSHDPSGRISTPFVPPYHYPGNPNGFYGTPTHHPHPYPFTYDPNFSRATAPPDSPQTPITGSVSNRRKSLVHRSRSRGRNVSFQGYENSFDDKDGEDVESSSSAPQTPEPAKNWQNGKARAQSVSEEQGATKKTARGKNRRGRSGSVADSGSEEEPSRSQTPGPPLRATSSDSVEVMQSKTRSSSKRVTRKR